MLARYAAFVRHRGVKPILTSWAIGGLPSSLVFFAVVLILSEEGDYLAGGMAAAVYGIGLALGAPPLARAVSRFGARAVLTVSCAAYSTALATTVVAVRTGAPVSAVLVAVVVAGLTAPPLAVCVRASWASMIDDPDVRRTAYSVQSTTMELFYIVGPAITGLLAALRDPTWALALAGCCAVAGALLFARSAPTLGTVKDTRRRWLLKPSRELVSLALVMLAVTSSFGFLELAVVAEAASSPAAAGLLLAAWSAGSAVGGIVYGGTASPSDERRHVGRLLTALAAGMAAPVICSGGPLWLLAVALAISGVVLAPAVAGLFAVVPSTVASTDEVTEAFGWLASMSLVGTALGSGLAGALVSAVGARTTFAAGAALVVAAVVTWHISTARRPVAAAGA